MDLEYIKKEMEEFDLKNSLNSKFLSMQIRLSGKCLYYGIFHVQLYREINSLQDIDLENIVC